MRLPFEIFVELVRARTWRNSGVSVDKTRTNRDASIEETSVSAVQFRKSAIREEAANVFYPMARARSSAARSPLCSQNVNPNNPVEMQAQSTLRPMI